MTPEQQKALALAKARRRRAEAEAGGAQPDLSQAPTVQNGPKAQVDRLTQEAMAAYEAGDEETGKALLVEASRASADGGMAPEGFTADPNTGGMTDLQSMQLPEGALVASGVGLMQGLGFGGGDEAMGVIAALTGGDRRFTMERAQEMERRAKEDHPYAYYGAAIPGAMASSLSAGKAMGITPAGSLPGLVGQGMAIGAGEGAVSGALSDNGGLADRLASGVTGAGIGAALGGAIPLVGAGVQRGARAASDAWRGARVGKEIGTELGISRNAGRVLGDLVSPDDPAAMQAAIAKAGPRAMLADASPTTSGMVDTYMRSPTPGARLAGERIANRASSAGDDIVNALAGGNGQALDPQANIKGIAAAARPTNKINYDAAYGKEIDWRSPAGVELRQLIETTPDDVLRRAQSERALWPRSAPSVPDSAYAGEFADTVTSGTGAKSWIANETDEISQFFDEVNKASGKVYKRPMAEVLKAKGGIDPTSKAAQDLRAMGISSQTHPGLYRVGGLKDLDNIPHSDIAEMFPNIPADGNYAARQAMIDALGDEAKGQPLRRTSEMFEASDREYLQSLIPEYEARQANLDKILSGPDAPAIVGDAVPTRTVEDIDMIKRTLDAMGRQGEGMGAAMGNSNLGAAAKARATAIRNAMSEAVPEYATALQGAADTIRRAQAVDFGTRILSPKMTVNDALEEIKTATGGERSAMREGLRGQFDHILGNVKAVGTDQNIDARQAISAFQQLSSPNAQRKMEALFGDEWPPIKESLDRAGAAIGLRARTAANSATAQRGVFSEATVDAVTPNAALRMKPLEAGSEALASLTNSNAAAIKRASRDVQSELADVLTREGNAPDTINAIVKALANSPVNTQAGKKARAVVDALLFGNSSRLTSGPQEMLQQKMQEWIARPQ